MYITGKNAIREYLKNNTKIYKAYVNKNMKDELISELKNKNISIEYIDKFKLDKISKNNQGIIIKVDDYKYKDISDIDDDIVVILDHLDDPHNLGAIIRTCEVAGIRNIIIPKDRSVSVNETVMKTSAGALNHINLIMVTNLTETMKKLKKDGFWFVGMDMSGDNYKKIDYTGKIGLVVGSEGFGMSKLVEQNCDFIATIPMRGKVNSLNASVAAGIIIFEAMSQRCD
ncbi:MAG: 23S rRNA (guanosine(2251)-2'-O)-methyltransferase RlmB [Bacillales bacterium]|nr:23S rRNA (guanosine(2251)-2'-O)-methyltransferase RlmB [Bacillales bacterium]